MIDFVFDLEDDLYLEDYKHFPHKKLLVHAHFIIEDNSFDAHDPMGCPVTVKRHQKELDRLEIFDVETNENITETIILREKSLYEDLKLEANRRKFGYVFR